MFIAVSCIIAIIELVLNVRVIIGVVNNEQLCGVKEHCFIPV
jgi:hypothetical protein